MTSSATRELVHWVSQAAATRQTEQNTVFGGVGLGPILVPLDDVEPLSIISCIHLWIFAISCILLSFHGTNLYFWISFVPTLLLLLIGTKLHYIVVKLAVEIRAETSYEGFHHFNLRNELFWFGRPRFLLLLIQFISFQNAFEMAIYLWSRWGIKGASCFTQKGGFLVTRLAFGVASQIWCSFITFPLYVIIAQMGSEFKKSIISESVKSSLLRWRCRVKASGTRQLLLLEDHNNNSDQIPLTEEITSANDEDDDDCKESSWRRRSLEQDQMKFWAGPAGP